MHLSSLNCRIWHVRLRVSPQPSPRKRLRRFPRDALGGYQDAKLSADDIGYVNAHVTSTPSGWLETIALKRFFGDCANKSADQLDKVP